MDIKAIYEKINGDYDDVMGRLRKEERVERFLKMFIDQDYIAPITEGFATDDAKKAFLEAHTLKGVCANLGIKKLGESSSELTESLRGESFSDNSKELFETVKTDYKEVMDVLKQER